MYKVLLFELTKELSTWQYYINNILFKFLDKFCSVYLNDILVYSDIEKKHKAYIKVILKKLQAAKLQVNIKKSEFYV